MRIGVQMRYENRTQFFKPTTRDVPGHKLWMNGHWRMGIGEYSGLDYALLDEAPSTGGVRRGPFCFTDHMGGLVRHVRDEAPKCLCSCDGLQ